MGFKVVFVMIFCMSSRIVCDSNCDVLKTSVKCFSPNWEYLECTVPVIKNCVIMEMKESHNVMVPIQSSSDVQIFRTSSHLESSDLQNFFTLANICVETLTLSIKSSCCDSATIDINIVKIVEPGDMNLKETLATSTSIEAHIERHQNLHCHSKFKIPLNYKVQLISQRKSSIMEFNFINLAENIDIIKVDNLDPDTKYEVFAKSQPTEAQNSSLWSPTLQFSVQTKPDVPPVAQISASGFSLTGLNRSVSLLSLHWAEVPSHLHHGPNFRYRVTVMQEKQQNENKLFETIFETEMAEANFLVPRNENITATITSVNQVGEASTASTISIPFLSSLDKVSLVDAIVVDKNNTYSVYWKHEGDKEGTITIFWCFFHIRNGVQWRSTDINKGGFSIPSKEGSAVLPVHLALTYRDNNNNNNNNYLVSTGMQKVTCILIPEHRKLHPVLKLQASLSESNQLVFLYHFSTCPFTNPSPYVRSYVLTYLKENTTKDASTVVGREPEIVVPHLTPGSCYLFKSLEITTLDGHLLKTDYNKTHCTAPVAPPKLISAIVSESDPEKLLITLEPGTLHSFSGNSSCKLDIDGREHIVDCSATVVLSHSIHPNNPCPSIRTSLCSPSKWPPHHCSPWSPFYPIVKAPPTPILNKLSIRPNSMLEVEYVTGPADTCEVRLAHNLSTRIFPIKSHDAPTCNNYVNSINIIHNISSVLIPMDLCQQYNVSVRCGNGVKTRVEDSRSVRMSGWSSAQTSELSCTEPLTPMGTLAGTTIGLIIVTIIISILFIRTYRYVQNLRRRFGFPDELGDIPLENMNQEQKAPMFGEPFGRINNNIPRPYHPDMNHEQTPFIPQPYDGVISNLPITCQKMEKEQENEVNISETTRNTDLTKNLNSTRPIDGYKNLNSLLQPLAAKENYVMFSEPSGSLLNNIPIPTHGIQPSQENIPEESLEKNDKFKQVENGYTAVETLLQTQASQGHYVMFSEASGSRCNTIPVPYQEIQASQDENISETTENTHVQKNVKSNQPVSGYTTVENLLQPQAAQGNYVILSEPSDHIPNPIPRPFQEQQAARENYVNISGTITNTHLEEDEHSNQPLNECTVLDALIPK